MTDARDWAKGLKKEQDAKRNSELEQHGRVALHRDIEAEKMPLLWQELLVEYGNYCSVYNEEVHPERTLAIHRSGQHKFIVRPDAMPEIIDGTFDPPTHRIQIIAGMRTFLYLPQIVLEGTGSVRLVSAQTQRVVTCAEVVQETLRAGLG